MALKRASRSPMASANTSTAIQPKPFSGVSPQTNTMTAGATPKLTKSARLSSSAPNLDCAFSARARRPSTPSRAAAITTRAMAIS